MSFSLLLPLDDDGAWQALGPGAGASDRLSLVAEGSSGPFGASRAVLRLLALPGAQGHRARRAFPPADLSSFDELLLWVRSDRPAEGSSSAPFRFELRLGSATAPIGAVSNDWQRFVGVTRAGHWERNRFSLEDLPNTIRGAVSTIELRCVSGEEGSRLDLADLAAAREEMLTDAERGLVAALSGRLTLGGQAAPAVIHEPGAPAPAVPGWLWVRLGDVRLDGERKPRTRSDFRGRGYRLLPPRVACELVYDLEAMADDRGDRHRLAEFVLRTLAPSSEIEVGGLPLPVRFQGTVPGPERPEGAAGLPLRFVLSTSLAVGTGEWVVPPFAEVAIELEETAAPR